jgi:hypothetical protein
MEKILEILKISNKRLVKKTNVIFVKDNSVDEINAES